MVTFTMYECYVANAAIVEELYIGKVTSREPGL
jgi:hypothetical protein